MMDARDLTALGELSAEANALAETSVERYGLSTRAMTRVLKVARTIADLAGAASIEPAHVREAVALRVLDRKPLLQIVAA